MYSERKGNLASDAVPLLKKQEWLAEVLIFAPTAKEPLRIKNDNYTSREQ
jgi:hypothetical protein